MVQSKNLGFDFKKILKQWVNIFYTLYYESSKKEWDYMIMDEGIAQAIVSLYTENNRENYQYCFNYFMSLINNEIRSIYIEVSLEKVLEQLTKRNNGKSRVDKLCGESKINMIKRIQYICENIACKNIVINNSRTLDDAVLKIKHYCCNG